MESASCDQNVWPDCNWRAVIDSMRYLLIVNAAVEIGAGLVLVCVPALATKLLLGESLDSPAALTVARVGGTAIFALGVGCAVARNDQRSQAARGLVVAMLIYNIGAVTALTFAGASDRQYGPLLRPGV